MPPGVTLNEAYQSMMLQSYDVVPQRTVILEGIKHLIQPTICLLSVQPKEIKEVERERESKEDDTTRHILDVDFFWHRCLRR